MVKTHLLVIGTLLLGALALLLPVYLVEAAPLAQTAQEGQVLFQSKCSSCHTIGGGRLVGPDLQDVAQRRSLDWLQAFIAAPDKVIASGDAVAAQLLKENNNVPMPNLGLKDADVAALLVYLQDPAAAGGAAPQPAAALPPGGAQAGQMIFSGQTRLANGGSACIACHTVAGTGALGGGSLGPDLTQVLRRYGEPGLAAALNNIVFPTMQGPFLNHPLTPQEQADLVAYFKWADGALTPAPAANLRTLFLGAGALGALALFGSLLFFWPRQRTSLSERLRQGQPTR